MRTIAIRTFRRSGAGSMRAAGAVRLPTWVELVVLCLAAARPSPLTADAAAEYAPAGNAAVRVEAADAEAETDDDTNDPTEDDRDTGADDGNPADAQTDDTNAETDNGRDADVDETADAEDGLRRWPAGLDNGRRRAMAEGKPMLVRAGADWCPACRVLKGEIAKPEVQEALAEWTLVSVDVEHSPEDARQLLVTATPTLKILTTTGRPVASHVGILRAGELTAWLKQHRKRARAAPDPVLLGSDKPSVLAVVKLLGAFGNRDPAVRRAAIGRLRAYPGVAGGAVLKTLREGALAQRLSALELLEAWEAPIRDLDPWQPETIDGDRLARLETWLDGLPEQDAAPADAPPEKLSKAQLAEARRQIDRMLRAEEAEAAAIRDRLARLGPPLAEPLDRWIDASDDDRHRERLRALRYRLAASDALVLRWPGGLQRLAATNPAERRAAAEQLAALAAEADQPLLLRLFADPDPLVRELSLRGLQRIGGSQSTAALAELLSDPEPNVRAAVLKLLEENPQPAMVPKVADYLKTEEDPDLIVHAVRFLRASGGQTAMRAMMRLVDHPSWQVRAAAAAGLGGSETSFRTLSSSRYPGFWTGTDTKGTTLQADAYAVLIRLLDAPTRSSSAGRSRDSRAPTWP